MRQAHAVLIWVALAMVIAVPIIGAATSPLLAWRNPIYIAAGLAGVVCLCLILLQPLLASGGLPGLTPVRSRRIHRVVGATLVLGVVFHVAGLWATSPPDVIDALLFTSPAPFSAWGVISMWALFATALMAALRRRLRLSLRKWRIGHMTLAAVIVLSAVTHAMLVEGTMQIASKTILCLLVLAVTANVLLRAWLHTRT